MATKRGLETEEEAEISTKSSIPPHLRNQEKRLIIILEQANLETVKAGKSFELLNSEDHKGLIKKFDKDPSRCRPDITHQVR
ncbi:ribosomal RNA small subunit methyltransferase NEP1-like [Centruroides sculpturatus]|uniref:ribosomal RNA small subunit methyltransferase NEP1-like n=1 Tax=Centruroides sculpturatus TaxID=218467 RepID=UPI000C6D6780|nr:ribosomal RNA small subunit methyltransferase NEP1-like [Centruroides sculpturatus]